MVSESDLAITGTTLTTSESFLRTTISMGFKLKKPGKQISNHDNIHMRRLLYLRMSCRADKEQAAVNSGILDVAITSSS